MRSDKSSSLACSGAQCWGLRLRFGVVLVEGSGLRGKRISSSSGDRAGTFLLGATI